MKCGFRCKLCNFLRVAVLLGEDLLHLTWASSSRRRPGRYATHGKQTSSVALLWPRRPELSAGIRPPARMQPVKGGPGFTEGFIKQEEPVSRQEQLPAADSRKPLALINRGGCQQEQAEGWDGDGAAIGLGPRTEGGIWCFCAPLGGIWRGSSFQVGAQQPGRFVSRDCRHSACLSSR